MLPLARGDLANLPHIFAIEGEQLSNAARGGELNPKGLKMQLGFVPRVAGVFFIGLESRLRGNDDF